jgi:CheY-like chemotaxis protein
VAWCGWQPPFRGSDSRLSLGLSQVYGFVRQSAGHVKIYSELGEGTTVKVYLPRHRGEWESVKTEDGPGKIARAIGKESVLVVEDDDALRAYTTESLRELGYRVLEDASGAAALEILAKAKDVDLMFTDVVMPGGVNGRQMADEVARRGLKLRYYSPRVIRAMRSFIMAGSTLASTQDIFGK